MPMIINEEIFAIIVKIIEYKCKIPTLHRKIIEKIILIKDM